MISLVLILISNLLLMVVSQQTSDPTESDDSGRQFKLILALIVAIVLIATILVIVIIILFALSSKNKRKGQNNQQLLQKAKRKTPEEKENNLNNSNSVFVAKGQPNNEKAKNDVGASGSFVFSGFSSDKPIPIEETYATALQDTGSASESGIYGQRPTDLNVKKAQPSNSKSVVIKDNKSKSGL